MSEPKKELWEDALGDFGFRIRYLYQDHWCDVEAWEIVAIGASDADPLFQRKQSCVRPDPVETTQEAERYLMGFIKWDGCSEFKFAPDKDMEFSHGHFHWCGPDHYRKHFALLEHLYRRAQSLMKSGNFEPWNKGEPRHGERQDPKADQSEENQ
jgi:hypothetical protein